MGKVALKEKNSKLGSRRRKSRSSGHKYLKPGTLAQLRRNKSFGSGSGVGRVSNEIEKKIVDVFGLDESEVLEDKVFDKSPVMLSPVVGTPKTPKIEECQSESRLESLPTDLLVKILCLLHHDQLRAVFHVSQRIRKAVILARQFYFNYTTPDRSRQEMLCFMTPRPSEHWPFLRWSDGKRVRIPIPHAPKALRHWPRPLSRLKVSDMRPVTTVLFEEPAFPARCLVRSLIPKPQCKPLASNRVLFGEDELCKAVAQNKLL